MKNIYTKIAVAPLFSCMILANTYASEMPKSKSIISGSALVNAFKHGLTAEDAVYEQLTTRLIA